MQEIQTKIDSLLHQEEIWWAQRAKIHWLKEGDRNTKFFHQKATERRNHDKIKTMDKGNNNITSKEEETQYILLQLSTKQFTSETLTIHEDD